ncbi:MAG: bacterial Ig-like domain-containing protein [Bacteroides sp.]|nr:bacterial Ig-like domain-containing protein [Bacillota bacterium]MCM1393997.1 bacterial Ig-like domain-containing protein [[Eubacterium] siraeum]MCM1455652.1 bacterial Ig-like domain-containing protein [Bacteroides sp.]
MKNKINKIFIIFLAAAIISLAACCLFACNDSKLEKISIENPLTEFKIGDEFSLGDDFKVIAHFGGGKKQDVTSKVEIRKEDGFDMNAAGNYIITVVYEGKREVYTITVGDFENILRRIEVDDSDVKKSYLIGDSISFDGLKLNCTYENAQGNLVDSVVTSLKNFDVEIKDKNGDVTSGVLMTLGQYTVTISSGAVGDSYTVSVDGVNLGTVQGAIFTGKAFKSNVLSGAYTAREGMDEESISDSFKYEYEFGNNYTYINQLLPSSDSAQYHLSLDPNIFCAKFKGEEMVVEGSINPAMMNGVPFLLWYYRGTTYGIEDTLVELYNNAKASSNGDLKYTVNEDEREYTFSFSGLKVISNKADYYETSVSFKLAEDYSVQYVEYTQKYWENNSALAGRNDYSPTFITDKNTGKTQPNGEYSFKSHVTVSQTSGTRTKSNPYTRDMFRFKSFDLTYNGDDLGDDGVIECSVDDKNIQIYIENANPSTASFLQDALYFDCEGYYGGEVDSTTFLSIPNAFMAYRRDNVINIALREGGTWTLKLRTASGIKKTVTLKVTGKAPTVMSGKIGNAASNSFYDSDVKTLAIGGEVYFYGSVNKAANDAQGFEITSDNAEFATVIETTFGGVKCFKFSATQNGEYTVEVASSVAPSVKCTFTFTVSEIPDYENILKGKYTVTDQEGNIYLVEFTPRNVDGEFDGSVKITKTPTDDNYVPLTQDAASQTLEYYVDQDALAITLTHSLGVNLGVGLEVNELGELILQDKYDDVYVLIPTEN